jgi:hypothetical protein
MLEAEPMARDDISSAIPIYSALAAENVQQSKVFVLSAEKRARARAYHGKCYILKVNTTVKLEAKWRIEEFLEYSW